VKVLLVGVCVEERFVPIFNKISSPQASISIAVIKYSRLIFEGFKRHLNEDCTGVFLIPIGMYPKAKVFCFKSRRVRGIYYLPFINILMFKQASIALSLACFALKWCYANRKEKKVVVFTCIYLPFLVPFVLLKQLSKLKLTSFVPDLPVYEFTYAKSELSIKRMFVPIYISLTNALCRSVDYFVFITDAMKSKFGEKPYSVVEGFIDIAGGYSECPTLTVRKTIMYAGAFLEKFGIKNLLEAFLLIPGGYELWLFGSGEMESEIRIAAGRDPRIKLWGNVSNKEVMEYERYATILINPRFTSNEFTKYSFPSKILEYMSSGRPVLTTRLEGIPHDYHDKLYFIEDESIEGMRDAIEWCLGKSDTELTEFGHCARNYVLAEKNNVVRIAEVLHELEKL
jgi:glycosyltransferase involved in cell wall biosynthesis